MVRDRQTDGWKKWHTEVGAPPKNNRFILQSYQRFRSEKHNVFTEENNKIALRADNDKRIQSINSIETYTSGPSGNIIRKNEEIKYRNIIKQ